MHSEDVEKLNNTQMNQIAVAYLLTHPEDVPEGAEKLMEKMRKFDASILGIMKTIQEAENTIKQLQPKAEQTMGAIEAVVDLLSDLIPEGKAKEWALKYDLNMAKSQFNSQTQRPQQAPMAPPQAQKADIAGSTAKTYNETNPVAPGV